MKPVLANSSSLPIPAPQVVVRGRLDRVRVFSVAALAVVVFGLWAVRWAGPIDLRYDAGVYYTLGTALAQGDGYRIISEPGRPLGVQYPPLLPLIVAAHQRLLGTSDIATVAPVLRGTYAVLFGLYAFAVLAVARAYLRPWPALFATLVCLFQVNTILYSDMLFTELPYALVGVLFVLTPVTRRLAAVPVAREALSGLLAIAGFLLRTAGIALLAAWVGDAVLRRRWRLAVTRAVVAAVPVVAWQGYVAHVTHSDAYRHPAYAYQRAPYQFYNVPYGENMALVDPFRPDQGRVGAVDMLSRIGANLAALPSALGEAASESNGFWRHALGMKTETEFDRARWTHRMARLPLWLISALIVTGAIGLVRRRAWPIVLVAGVSVALTCTTPWPEQFARYLVPIAAFLGIAALVGVARWTAWFRRGGWRWPRYALGAFGGLVAFVQLDAVQMIFRERQYDPATYVPGRGIDAPRLFYFGWPWAEWDQARRWVQQHAAATDVVATTSPHQVFLTAGLAAVMPPMERDPVKARALMDSVPVRWLIVDRLAFLDIGRVYALPAVESDPAQWRLAATFGGARVYERIGLPQNRGRHG